jgi:arylsulfatase A-like enzyme
VPEWFGPPPEEQADRYLQTIRYTDRFLAALDVELTRLGLADNSIFVVAGDHGEAFSEHHMMGHERIAYDEVLNVPMCLRAPFLVRPGRRIDAPVSSVDLTPTILSLLGVDTSAIPFDGANVLGSLPTDRKVYFSGWMQQGPAGFVEGHDKVIYEPEQGTVKLYRLLSDPLELHGLELPENEAKRLQEEIVAWRRNTLFQVNQEETGEMILFGSWRCKWTGRETDVKYIKDR